MSGRSKGVFGEHILALHIALFINGYFPEIGGVEIGARNLNAEYVKRGHRVTVFTSQSRRELPEEEQIDGVQVYRFRWGGFGCAGLRGGLAEPP